MILEFHDGFKNASQVHVTRFLLMDDSGNPIIAATDNGDRSFTLTHIGEGEFLFRQGLKEMGIAKTTVLTDAKFEPPKGL